MKSFNFIIVNSGREINSVIQSRDWGMARQQILAQYPGWNICVINEVR